MTTIHIVQNREEYGEIENIKAFFVEGEAKDYMNHLKDRLREFNQLFDENPDINHEEYEDVMGIDQLHIAAMEVY